MAGSLSDQSEGLSPAARYQRFKAHTRHEKTVAAAFMRSLPFDLDDFQIKALDDLEAGDNLLVAAPTGAGKTVVADFSIFLAQEENVKAFYTTPIKALSNQKYRELVNQYGESQVGLLTGDMSLNSEANIVVMTTEVLRNMIYERSTTLDALRYVILDEVHYLGDRFRGQVWEEVIVNLPRRVKIVGLSATVSNIEDFGAWIRSVRGPTALIVSETRPVPLDQSVVIQPAPRREPEVYDLYRDQPEAVPGPKRKGDWAARVNPELAARLKELDYQAQRLGRAEEPGGHPAKTGRRQRPSAADRGRSVNRRFTPSRWAVVDELDYLDLLPGIYFIFSRAGCDAAVQQCLDAGLELTTDQEARRIRAIADEMARGAMSAEDLKTLHYASFRFALEQGFAAHHAGLVALFREIVEKVFEEGLVKVVFATETFALGINMPARCVIIEKLDKFDGSGHVPLTPGEYTQLTGRAGRRGIDTIGHAVVVDHPGFDPAALAALSSRRVYPLHSQFRPSFNMAVNLLNVDDYDMARQTLDQSFAQWEATRSAQELEAAIASLEDSVRHYEATFACRFGDFKEFLAIRAKLTDLQRGERRKLKHAGFPSEAARAKAFARLDDAIAELREQERVHPCRSCPDLADHLKWANRWTRQVRELERLRGNYVNRTGSVARRFDLICGVLEDLDYIRPDHSLTWRGDLLRRLYTEKDLLFSECLIQGVFDGCDPQELAALVSGVVFESRRTARPEPVHLPGGRRGVISRGAEQMGEIWEDLSYTVEEAGLEPLDELDFGLAETVYDWTADKPLEQILRQGNLGAGDFVRSCKRLCDVLGQLRTAADYLPQGDRLRESARVAYELVDRGVVAYSGLGIEAAQGEQPARE